MKSKISLCTALLLIVTSMSFLVSCESENYFESIETNVVDYTYLSLAEKDLEDAFMYTTPIFNEANRRFYSTTKIVDGMIVQALDDVDLMMSQCLISHFKEELRELNLRIQKEEMAVYVYSESPFDYIFYDPSQKERGFSMLLSRSPENNGVDYEPLNLSEASSDDMIGLIGQMDSDKSSEGWNNLNEYVDFSSYEGWNQSKPYFSETYTTEIEGEEISYTINVCNMKVANGGNDKNGMYTIAYIDEKITSTGYFVAYRNIYNETIFSIYTPSKELYDQLFN